MISHNTSLPIPLRLALRELRGGLAGFRIFVACLILGVTAIAAVGSLTSAIQESITREGQSILGGDIEINIFQQEADQALYTWAEGYGRLSSSARLRTMARTVPENGEASSTLVELRAVDNLYPLYGNFITSLALDHSGLFTKEGKHWGAAIEPALAGRLKVKLGDTLRLGNITVKVRALIEKEPDKANLGFQLGPTVMVSTEAFRQTDLITPGSLVNYYYKLRLNQGGELAKTLESLEATFPDNAWRVRSRNTSAPGLRRFLDQMGMFLTLVGIAALVVGGVGVGNAVKGYMDRKTKTIATLKILGASGSTIFKTYFLQVLIIGFAATLIGLSLGAALPGVLATFLPDSLPVQTGAGFYPKALVMAALYGLLVTIAFTTWPLAKARDLPAMRLFRALVSPDRKWPRPAYLALTGLAAAVVVLIAVTMADNAVLAAGFLGGTALTFLLLRLTSLMIEKTAAKAPRAGSAITRMTIANLHRPGAATGAVVLSLGLGLTLFSGLALVEGNMTRQLENDIPEDAPAFFLLDIQKHQLADFTETALSLPGVEELVTVPSLRGRISKLNGLPASEDKAADNVRWVLRGDRGLSYMDELSEGGEIVEGEWWPVSYSGPPEISLGKEVADGLGLKIGDTLTVTVLGREITATIRSLREINWGTFGFNFIILFDPYTLQAAPHSYMATLKTTGNTETETYQALTGKFTNVTAVRMKEVLSSVNEMMTQVSTAVRATAFVAIIAGVLVLAGALAAGFRQRVYESVILKVVGAVRKQILTAYLMEYALIGLVTALIALTLGGLAGWAFISLAMKMPFTLLPEPMILTVASSLIVTICAGLASTLKILSVRPNQVLRTE